MERIELTSPHNLPGSEVSPTGDGGRQALKDYAGRYEIDSPIVAVEGEWEYDAFIVRVVEHAGGDRARINRHGRIVSNDQ